MLRFKFVAEMKGFEPLIRLPVFTISSRAHSTALPHLQRRAIILIHKLFARALYLTLSFN